MGHAAVKSLHGFERFAMLPSFIFCAILLSWAGWSEGQTLEETPRQASTPDLQADRNQVGRYEKIEFTVLWDREYQDPFDPQEVDIHLRIQTPSGRRIVLPAFWYQPFERRIFPEQRGRVDWFYPRGKPRWCARFAPSEVGEYAAVACVTDRHGEVHSETPVRFHSIASKRRGFLRQARSEPRLFETDDGSPFFAIGQNLAFIGLQQYFSVKKAEETFRILADHRANYLRIWTCCEDWALCIEGRKSAWARSWDWRPPVVPMPPGDGFVEGRKCVTLKGVAGNRLTASPSHPIAVLPETNYVFSGKVRCAAGTSVEVDLPGVGIRPLAQPGGSESWNEFAFEFRTGAKQFWLEPIVFHLATDGQAWFDQLSLKEVGSQFELLWEAEVNRPSRGFYNPPDCAMLDVLLEAAEREGIYLQLCLLTRDLYMDDLKEPESPAYDRAIEDAKRFFRYAVARWGYSTSVAAWEYWNEMNPGLPTDRFYTVLGNYLKEIDPYQHLRATSTWAPSTRDWQHPSLDIADMHFYLRPNEKRLSDEVEAALDRSSFLRTHAPGKPALLSEFGLATEKWGLSSDMKADRQLIHFHNALWASSLSGLSGTAMFWWWEQLDQLNACRHYRPLATFLADLPWGREPLESFHDTIADGRICLVGLRGSSGAWCWLINKDAVWVGSLLAGKELKPVAAAPLRLEMPGDHQYEVAWFDTWAGKWRSPPQTLHSRSKILLLEVPRLERDIAVRIRLVSP